MESRVSTIFSKFCASFQKETMIILPKKAKLLLRKEKMLSSESVLLSKKAGYKEKYPEKEREVMKNNNQINIPQAREAMDRFKMQAAQEVGVNLTNGYNGHLTSREAGSVGGQMVKKMIEAYEQGMQ